MNILNEKARARARFYQQVQCEKCGARRGAPCIAAPSGFVYWNAFHMARMRACWSIYGRVQNYLLWAMRTCPKPRIVCFSQYEKRKNPCNFQKSSLI